MSQGLVVWFTGMSGSGKSSIARDAADLLSARGLSVEILDGDELRRTRAKHLGFSADDVMESNRIAMEVCAELRQDSDVVLVPRISPLRQGRLLARQGLGEAFIEVYVKASIETVSRRDPKGLYQRARESSSVKPIGLPGGLPFEEPADPDLILDTDACGQQALSVTLASFIEAAIEARIQRPISGD